MKVLYLTVPSYFDLDVSLVRELSTFVDVHAMLIVSPQSKKSSAFSIDEIYRECGVFSAQEYEGFRTYDNAVDVKRWSIANNPDNSANSCLKLSKKIKAFAKINHFDLIHTTTSCKTALFLAPYLWKFPHTLFTVHDPISHNRISLFDEILRRKMFYNANKNLLLLSRALLEQFCQRYHIDCNRIYFSSLSVYDMLTRYTPPENEYGEYVLFFGRIEKYKGVDLLINAYEKSDLPSNGVKLIVAGKGSVNYDDSNLPKNVVLINRFVENDELAGLIRNCKYVILPYLSATQSGCVMSAFAFNKPILATDVGDLPYTIENGKTGMICKANNRSALCEAMNEMEHADLKTMEMNIKEKYQKRGGHSWYRIAESLYGVYKEIVDGGHI